MSDSSRRDLSACRRRCEEWYLKFLRNRLGAIAPDILSNLTEKPALAFEITPPFLKSIIHLLETEGNLSITELLETLRDDGKIKWQDEQPETAYQLLFISIGLVTMLYKPVPTPEHGRFQIVSSQEHFEQPDTWLRDRQDMEKVDDPFGMLLQAFGGFRGPIPHSEGIFEDISQSRNKNDLTSLISANLSYYTLSRLAGAHVVWTESACEHLEFNIRTRSLKVFRFPSFCNYICSGASNETYLCRYALRSPNATPSLSPLN